MPWYWCTAMHELSAGDSSRLIPLEELSYVAERPLHSALIKQRFEDFCVDEELGFALTGQGEHLCVQVRKTDLSTTDVVRRLSESTGADLHRIGYSGLKDKRGECTQWFSLQIPEHQAQALTGIEDRRLQILDTARNARKIKTGSHKSNRFKIRLRECNGPQSGFEQSLARIKRSGVPNYFGAQRFGNHMSNVTQVLELMQSEPDADHARPSSRRRPGRFKRGMLYSAARAYLFNQLLSTRLRLGNWSSYLAGDVLNLDGTSRCFVLDDDQQWDQELEQRLQCFDIHITGALSGASDSKDKYISRRAAADIEEAVFKQFNLLVAGLKKFGLKASRRALRFVPDNLEWRWLAEHDLELNFSLPRGTYATSLLRELCNTS